MQTVLDELLSRSAFDPRREPPDVVATLTADEVKVIPELRELVDARGAEILDLPRDTATAGSNLRVREHDWWISKRPPRQFADLGIERFSRNRARMSYRIGRTEFRQRIAAHKVGARPALIIR